MRDPTSVVYKCGIVHREELPDRDPRPSRTTPKPGRTRRRATDPRRPTPSRSRPRESRPHSPIPVEPGPARPARPARAYELAQLDFPSRLAAAGNLHLLAKDLVGEKHVTGYSIYLATSQRMVLCDLHRQLAEIVRKLADGRRADSELIEEAKELLTEYCNAVRDYNFITERLAKAREEGEDNPFRISTKSLLDLCLMRDTGLVPAKGRENLSWKNLYRLVSEDKEKYHKLESVLSYESKNKRWNMVTRNLYIKRLAIGLAGRTALITLMLIMVLHKDLVMSLVTTTAATILFAGALALLGTKLKGETVLASVAAYAAVLVVFVGTSG